MGLLELLKQGQMEVLDGFLVDSLADLGGVLQAIVPEVEERIGLMEEVVGLRAPVDERGGLG